MDGLCRQLNLAFEYQGIQHFKEVAFFRDSLNDIQTKDEAKRQECKQLGIKLVEIPYTVAESGANKLEQYIKKRISKYVLSKITIDYSKEKSALVNRINRLRFNDSLVCVKIDRIVGGRVYVKMKCKNSHEWVAISHSITHKGYGCPTCAGQNRTIDDVKLIAIERGGRCLSKTYVNAICKMKWQCPMNHKWSASLNKVLCGRWCPECAKKSRIENRRLNKGWSYEIIRQLYENGMSVKDVCVKLNICSATAKKAIKGSQQCK